MRIVFLAFFLLLAGCGEPELKSPNPDLTDPYFQVRNAGKVVALTPLKDYDTGGTGFEIQAPSGKVYTLTNHHICEDAKKDPALMAHTSDGREVQVAIIENSKTEDLCLLEAVPGLPSFQMAGELQDARPGTYVVVYGHPYLDNLETAGGIILGYGPTTTSEDFEKGTCTLFGEMVVHEDGFFGLRKKKICLRTLFSGYTNAFVFPGNSGSPVLNLDEKVVGVAYAANDKTHLGAIVPLSSVKDFLSSR